MPELLHPVSLRQAAGINDGKPLSLQVCGQGVLVERVYRATKEVFHSCSRFPRCPPTKED